MCNRFPHPQSNFQNHAHQRRPNTFSHEPTPNPTIKIPIEFAQQKYVKIEIEMVYHFKIAPDFNFQFWILYQIRNSRAIPETLRFRVYVKLEI